MCVSKNSGGSETNGVPLMVSSCITAGLEAGLVPGRGAYTLSIDCNNGKASMRIDHIHVCQNVILIGVVLNNADTVNPDELCIEPLCQVYCVSQRC
jgi:hypothetical protein